jgi:heterodisulfide reductase subunit B
MEYAYFIGCTAPVRALNYELSVRKVADALGIKLVDLEDFSCCGYPINSYNHLLAHTIAARNLCIAQQKGLDIITICNACTGTLAKTVKMLSSDTDRKKINDKLSKIGYEYKGTVKVTHFVKFILDNIGVDKLKEMVVKNLKGLKVAVHYGCHYLKPSDVYGTMESVEFPESIDRLVQALGADTVNYMNKIECCGAPILGIDEGTALAIANDKLRFMKIAQSDLITLTCPFCSIMYDLNQRSIEKKFSTTYKLPVIYYTQLLGLALGIKPDELGFKFNRVKADGIIAKVPA